MGFSLYSENKAGIAKSQIGIIRALKFAGHDVSVLSFRDIDNHVLISQLGLGIEIENLSIHSRLFRLMLPLFPGYLSGIIEKYDAFIETEGHFFIRGNTTRIFVVHDLFPELYPHDFARRLLLTRKAFFYRLKSDTNNCKIITPSFYTSKTLQSYFNLHSYSLYWGYDQKNALVSDYTKKELSDKLRFVFIGRKDARKNINYLIEEWRIFVQKEPGLNVELILAGSQSSSLKLPNKSELRALKIIDLGYISAEEKLGLLRRADCMIYPSRVEGFGFPILEAWDFSLPIICNRSSCLPEIAGNAAIYFEEDSEDLNGVLSDFCRNEYPLDILVERGLDRLSSYSWINWAQRFTNEILQ